MGAPFPGMDPWLEHPGLWPDVHNAAIAELRLRLGRSLRPRYYVALEERTYLADGHELLVGVPDAAVVRRHKDEVAPTATVKSAPSAAALAVRVPTPTEVHEFYLEIRKPATHQVIAVVELLSPSNKLEAGGGRQRYKDKRLSILSSKTHLVEIDLLRSGRPMRVYDADAAAFSYRILVSRSNSRPQAQLFAFSVRDPIPLFHLPLEADEVEPAVDLGAVLHDIYNPAGWDLRIDYAAEPVPPLSPTDDEWADNVLRAAGRRP